METSKPTINDLTDAELSVLVAECRAGAAFWAETRGDYTLAVMCDAARPPWQHWDPKEVERNKPRYRRITGLEAVRMGFFGRGAPDYATSADAVLPLLEKEGGFTIDRTPLADDDELYRVSLRSRDGQGLASTLARAGCIALLSAY